jgi:hypothetical protein
VSASSNRTRSAIFPAVCAALAALALGHALEIHNGFYQPAALNWVTAALSLCAIGVLAHRRAESLRIADSLLIIVVAAGIGWQLWQLLTARSPGMYLRGGASISLFKAGVVLQGVLVALGVSRVRLFHRIWFVAFLVVSALIGTWLIHASPDPHIDVVTVHREAITALLQHQDPYRISFENIYGADSGFYYNPAAVIGNRIAIAYPYPPASLLLAVPGQVLFDDYRYSELACLIAAAALIGFTRRTLTAKLAACLLLTTPRVWFVLEQGWTEPIAVFTLALTLFIVARNPVMAGWPAGLFLVTKQYLGFTGLSVLRIALMRPRQWHWIVLGLIIVAAAMTLPFALWHPNAFMRNVVWLQTLEPFRIDSLSYLSWAARRGLGQGSFLWAVGAAAVAAITGIAATRNTPQGFVLSVALTMFAMFAFGSKAFCNYYFFVIGALCCAVATHLPASRDNHTQRFTG